MDEQFKEPSADNRRRHLTVVFADLCGSTARSLSMEEEIYADLLQSVRRLAHEIVPRHGGLVVRTQGDGIVAIFGYPSAREDDGRRAVEATLELHEQVRALDRTGEWPGPQPIALHSGIHAGRVLLRPGGLEGALFELIGPVPNIAAHLSDRAARDEVLVSEPTLGPLLRHFVVGERVSMVLGGRPSPLPAVQVLGCKARPDDDETAAVSPVRAPLAGRQSSLSLLDRRLHELRSGRPRLIAVVGGAGLGKTRLLEEFLQEAAHTGCAIHRGYCESNLSAEPLQPFLQILRTWVGITPGLSSAEAGEAVSNFLVRVGPEAEALAGDLRQTLSLPSIDDDGRRLGADRRVAALQAVFERQAARVPQLLFIDDWQWSDDLSRQMLASLLNLQRPLLVILTTRSLGADDALLASAERIDLAPLSLEEARAVIGNLLPGTHPFVAAEIHRYSGGNPLFIEELCHLARTEGGVVRLDRLHPGSAWLNALIESRVARLEEGQAALVRCAAVIGNAVPCWLLERLTGVGEHDVRLQALAEQDLVFPAEQAGLLRFKHGIARDVIYESVGLREKTALHLRIAQALAAQAEEHGQGQEERYEALAYHYAAAAEPREAARYAELAGDKALASSALDRARLQFRAALQALDRAGLVGREDRARWIAIVQRLGMACVFDPLGLEDGLSLFERGVDLAAGLNDMPTLARAEYWLTYIAYARGEAAFAIRHGQHALELAEADGDVRLAAQVRATLGQALAAAADYPRALPMLERAVDVKRRQVQRGSGLAVGSAYSLATKALVLADQGDFDAAQDCFDLALDMVQGTGHQIESSVLGWLTTVLLWRGRWSEAIDSSARSSAIAASCKSTHLYAMHLAQSAYAQWVLTRRAESLLALQDATAWVEAQRGKLVISLNHGWLADALVTAGQIPQARTQVAKALWRGRALDRVGEAMACRAMARAAASTGDWPRAQRSLALARRAAVARTSAHEQAGNDFCEAEVRVLQGRRGEARALLDQASLAFERMGMRWHLGRARLLDESL